jgi:hypothetical protein
MKTARNLWPFGIALAFVLFFAGVAAVIVIASRHGDTLVSDNYYEQELKFQGQMEAAARAKNAGATLRFDAATGKIFLALPSEQLKQTFSGKVILYRASAQALDQEFLLKPESDGAQVVDVSGLAAGPWLVRVRWNAGGQEFYLEEKINVAGK